MKRLQLAAMVALLALGLWLVIGPALMQQRIAPTPGAAALTIDGGGRKIRAERLPASDGVERYHFLTRAKDLPSSPLPADEFWSIIRRVQGAGGERPVLLTALNVSSWVGVAWVAFGFVGQLAFFGRMALQWVASERAGRSVVPAAFWWLSLVGGLMLFTYFVWRKEVVGVMGQSAGVVIYMRNLALIYGARSGTADPAQESPGARAHPPEAELEAAAIREDAPNPQAV